MAAKEQNRPQRQAPSTDPVRISELPDGDDPRTGDEVAAVRGGSTVRTALGTAAGKQTGANPGNVVELDDTGHIPDALIPDSIMRDAELTAHAVRNLLGLTPDEVNDLVTGASWNGATRTLTLPQNDGSSIAIVIPGGDGGPADGVVASGRFNEDQTELILTLSTGGTVTITVPSELRNPDKLSRYPENPQAIKSAWIGDYKFLSMYQNVVYNANTFNSVGLGPRSVMVGPVVGGELSMQIRLQDIDTEGADYLTDTGTIGKRLRMFEGGTERLHGRIKAVLHLTGTIYQVTLDNEPIVGSLNNAIELAVQIESQQEAIRYYPTDPQDIRPAGMSHYESPGTYRVAAFNQVAWNLHNIDAGMMMFDGADSANSRLLKIHMTTRDIDTLFGKMKPGARFSLVDAADTVVWSCIILEAHLRIRAAAHHILELTRDNTEASTLTTINAGTPLTLRVDGEWVDQILALIIANRVAPGSGENNPPAASDHEAINLTEVALRSWSPAKLLTMLRANIKPAFAAVEPNWILRTSPWGDFTLTIHDIEPKLLPQVTKLEIWVAGSKVKTVDFNPAAPDDNFVIEFTAARAGLLTTWPDNLAGETHARGNVDFRTAAGALVSEIGFSFRVLDARPASVAYTPRLHEVFSTSQDLGGAYITTTFTFVAGKIYYFESTEPKERSFVQDQENKIGTGWARSDLLLGMTANAGTDPDAADFFAVYTGFGSNRIFVGRNAANKMLLASSSAQIDARPFKVYELR